MKKILAILMSLLLLCSMAFAEGVSFTATDVEGNTVTEEILADYDLTMVNVWATWCGFCIEEMPAFADLKNSLPENVNLITICEDASIEPELTQQILEASGANFTTLAATADMFYKQQLLLEDIEIHKFYGGMLSNVYAFPTTMFLDSEGKPVGEDVVGVPSLDDPAGAYLSIIMERLAMLEA